MEKYRSIDGESLTPFNKKQLIPLSFELTPIVPLQRLEIVARALSALWRDLQLDGGPIIFISPAHGMYTEHHPILLDQFVESGKQRKRRQSGQLASWQRLDPPAYSYGIAATAQSGPLLKDDMLHHARPGDRHTVPSVPAGWLRYSFASGWTALSVYFDYQ